MDVELSKSSNQFYKDTKRDTIPKTTKKKKFAHSPNRRTKILKKFVPSSVAQVELHKEQPKGELDFSTLRHSFNSKVNSALSLTSVPSPAYEFRTHTATSEEFVGSTITTGTTRSECNKDMQLQRGLPESVSGERTRIFRRPDYKELHRSVPSLSFVGRHSKPHIVRETAKYIEELRLKVDRKYSTPTDREKATRYIKARLSQCQQQPNLSQECSKLFGSSSSQTRPERATRHIKAKLSQCQQQPNLSQECSKLSGSSSSQTRPERATRYIEAKLSQCQQQPNLSQECSKLSGSSSSQTSPCSNDEKSKS